MNMLDERGINAEFAYTGGTESNNTLSGDSTLRSLQDRMRSRVGSLGFWRARGASAGA